MATMSGLSRAQVEAAIAAGDPDIRNPKHLRRFHTALANAASASCDIFILGDSVAEGVDVNDYATRWQALVRDALRDRYQPEGVTGGLGYFPFVNPGTWLNSPITQATGLTSRGTTTSYGLQRRGSSVNTALGTDVDITWTGTGIWVLHAKNGVNPRGFTVSIDAGEGENVETSNGTIDTVDGFYWESDALDAGEHVATITPQGTASALVSGVYLFNGDEDAGIRIWDGAKSGATTASFTTSGSTWADYLPTIDPDLVLIELGANDSSNSLGIDTYIANMESLIATFRDGQTVPPSIVLVSHAARSYEGDWQEYLDALRQLAVDDGDLAFFDVESRFGWGDEALAAGLKPQADTVHLTALGAKFWTNALVNFLEP